MNNGDKSSSCVVFSDKEYPERNGELTYTNVGVNMMLLWQEKICLQLKRRIRRSAAKRKTWLCIKDRRTSMFCT